jgi:hypothetical protein
MKTNKEEVKDVWEYSFYRASLKRNGETFTLMTPDGKNSLSKEDAELLLNKLNK